MPITIINSLRCLVLLGALLAVRPLYAADTLFEFYNTNLNHYFLTIDPAEATAIDSGAAGPGWQRTGKNILAYRSAATAPAGVVVVCRFYGNQANGGPNGHFYTADAAECAAVKQDPGWTFERNEFYVTVPVNGTCTGGGLPVYRVYNGRFVERDSNHRYTTDVPTYNLMVSMGWRAEGVVFCGAPADTPVVIGDGRCGNTLVQPGRTITYQQKDAEGFQRTMGLATMFNGQNALAVLDRYLTTGNTVTAYLVESAVSFTNIGNRRVQSGMTQDIYFVPGLPAHKQWTVGQAVAFDTQILPQGGSGEDAREAGTITYEGLVSVTVPSGTYTVCKFRILSTIEFMQSGGVQTTTADLWVEPSIGGIKEVIDASLRVGGNSLPSTTTVIEATAVL